MANLRFFVEPKLENNHFSPEEIEGWNSWLQANYKVYLAFRQQARCDIAAKVKYLSARDMVAVIRRTKKYSIPNEISCFLAIMFCEEFKEQFPHYRKLFVIKKKPRI